jgi:hypothetical protein
MAKRAKESQPETGTIIVENAESDVPPVEAKPALPPPPSVPPAAPSGKASGPSFGDRVMSFFRFLLRLVMLLLFLGLLSVLLYLALPWLYQRFIRPVEQNTAEVRELQTQQEQIEQEMADLQARLAAMEDGQNEHGESFTAIDQRLNEIEKEVRDRTESLESLERTLSDLEEQNEAHSIELERQIKLLKAMELLSRARLSMYQSNFGLARQDVQVGRDLLAEVQPLSPLDSAAELNAVILRLDMVLTNLPAFPVAAADDLDIAWQILLSGVPEEMPTATMTPSGSASPTSSAADVTGTPTPQASAQPTATP